MKRFCMNRKRSLTALLLCIVMILGLTGCGKNGEGNGDGGNQGYASDVAYVAEYLDIQGADSFVNLKEVDGVLHILTAEWGEETTSYKLITYNLLDGSTTETTLESATEGGYFSSVFFNEDGSLEVIEMKDDYDEEWNLLSSERYFNMYGADGTLISSEEASAKLQLDEGMYISTFIKDAEGNYLIGSWDSPLRIYSPELQFTGEIPNDGNGMMESLCVTESGKVVASGWSNTGMSVDVAVLDVAGKKLGTAISTNKTSGSSRVWPGMGDSILYLNGNLLCSVDVVTGEITTITDVMDMDVNADYIQSVHALDDGSFLMTFYDYMSADGGASVLIAKPVDPSTIVEKTELTIATIYTSQGLNEAVIAFNRSNEEYRIKIVDYMTEDYDFDTALTNLQNDIAAGNVPDMIDVSSTNMPWKNWASKDIITDLYPLMEADGEFAKEELLANVRAAYEVDGSLYVLPTTVALSGVMVKEKFVPDVTSLSPEFLLELESQLPEDVKLFFYNSQGNVMYNMVYNNMSAYVDYEIGECYFDTDEFKAVLAYAKEQPADEGFMEIGSGPGYLREDKVIFYDTTISQLTDWQFYNYVFGEDVATVGFGNEGDGLKLIQMGCTLTITEQCEYKDVAWDFLKTFVSEETQTAELLWGIPVTQTGLDNFIYDAQHMEHSHGYGWDDVNIELTSATDEEVEEFLAVFEQADEVSTQDSAIMAIIEEEVAPYFEGQKTADEVADIIQSRVDIYLKENL